MILFFSLFDTFGHADSSRGTYEAAEMAANATFSVETRLA